MNNKIKYPQLQDLVWLRKKVETTPLRLIAKEVGCSYSAVVYQTRKQGIRIPIRNFHIVSETGRERIRAALKKKYPDGRNGSQAPNWRGGRTKNKVGWYIHVPEYPNANRDGYVFEHRLVMEKKIGRYLRPQEIVHHINGDQYDNRPENLMLVNRSQHVTEHYNGLKKWEIAKGYIVRMEDILSSPARVLEIS